MKALANVDLRTVAESDLPNIAIDVAAELLNEAANHKTAREKRDAVQIGGMMDDPMGKAMTLTMADQVFRSTSPVRCADQFRYLIDQYGVPQYLPKISQLAMKMGAAASALFPQLVMPMVTEQMRKESSTVILPAEKEKLYPHIDRRTANGVRINVNLLGEAILGEAEAAHRLEGNLELLRDPRITYISVKLSNVFSQLNLLAFDHTIERVQINLRKLYREAIANPYQDENGKKRAKFVNLDMEEYRDLQLTTAAFMRTLDEDEFKSLEAGIVLQAYLPDSYKVQQQLTEWAKKRVANGGAGIKVRLVKGANLAMEEVEADLHGWEVAPYHSKHDSDSNFKRMVEFAVQPENAAAVRIGVASHNLFDISYAMVLRERHGVTDRVEFEMLEGMANSQAKVVQDASGGMLLYAPIVSKHDFHSAIAYLVRRLDENTAEENFLRDLFALKVGSDTWDKQKKRFLDACRDKDTVRDTPYRDQDRSQADQRVPACLPGQPFINEPDTDWTVPANRTWIHDCRERRLAAEPEQIPVVIDGEEIGYDFRGTGSDPSRPGVVAYRYALAKMSDVNNALDVSERAFADWSKTSIDERKALLDKAAALIAAERGEILAAMTLDGGKSIVEADPEISEAIDFATYYARSFDALVNHSDVEAQPLGTFVVAPPWNFPFAIPCGGVLAALMAGNTVILKPAPQAVLCGWVLAQLLWKAGIPKDVLQFVPAPDNEIGKRLITSEKTAGVILTGAFDTAKLFQSWKPELNLYAETSGKNSLIITGAADLDLAVKDLVRSAFGNAGQKCSAASIAIIEAEVYDNPIFMQQLKDAAESLAVGSAWDPASVVTPVIQAPEENLSEALHSLKDGEEWLLEPTMVDNNPCLWSPGIRTGVKPGSWYHRTECFGPVLGLIRVESLEEAIAVQNDSQFGLTGGIHSLDPREIAIWREKVEVGNAYINRSTTGAIVNRQPFGGWKNSVFGPGTKAGGPNYTLTLCRWEQVALPSTRTELSNETSEILQTIRRWITDTESVAIVEAAAHSYTEAWKTEFSQEHDPSQLLGETNHFRYRPLTNGVLIRVEDDDPTYIAGAALAAAITDVPLQISLSAPSALADALGYETIIETADDLAKRLAAGKEKFDVVRIPWSVPTEVWQAANSHHFNVVDQPILANGRLELIFWTKEQAVSETVHRYGNRIPKPHEVELAKA
ncbi:bifunctional proline dehydrogenase/L-glutamate gamma-semialdehyde dehydrogenase [Sulfuriroseicoccus oceanibius]|uniref:L-glutamate gamma-semialdehyde dehydrogenase n=1 Tax=Sulfuriroseicoccus oceanibius TaxID=2707525 RepID=A0A6B3LDU8_9BACT|nr:bifunctional proline dehydrogenase/L-glutamate gamma-semialdehyde dehydrogenase [Sulfuriroseicoccus oceanibius]QQL44471.1 bifunctional proline dehydrogenase/L-glutamate gamma-semialdehyde dehydrogenase [Sulfuriroseicoccus oceanibius]